jgi:hypothetical protein
MACGPLLRKPLLAILEKYLPAATTAASRP